jgi:8-hydroxy-5-deazaflavin:NADPH oxidoreductase
VADGVAPDGYLAGDDDQAKQTVTELVSSIGFRPVDVGPLVMARALEALALLKIMLQIRNNWPLAGRLQAGRPHLLTRP